MIFLQKEHFDITGMTCSACSSRVEKAVGKLPGIINHSVNLLKNSMVVEFDEKLLSTNEIIQAVEKAGYGASLHYNQSLSKQSPTKIENKAEAIHTQMKQRLFISIIFMLPLFYISMGHMFSLPMPSLLLGTENALSFAFTQFLLLIPIVFVNFKYYSVGFKTLFQLSPNMDSLIALGSSAAIVYGIYAIYKISFALGHGDLSTAHHFSMDLYFESAGMILTLITLGKFLESRAKNKTSDAITKLMNLAPKTALRLENNQEQEISIDDVKLNDILIVKAGASIPTDGIIIEGHGVIDESSLTGEPIPCDKTIDQTVIGGTINKSGYFKMRVTKIGENTTLAQIINLVDDATSSKAPIAKIADKISAIFVPIVITLAIIATIIWLFKGESLEFALSIGICVLVISCPCALGLATPTAIMVGTGKGASLGILSKSAQALETLHNINTVVLDKTGTITQGKPQVTDIYTSKEVTLQQLLTVASSLEKLSEHPLGEAILQVADKHNISTLAVENFKQIAGQGLSGIINNSICLAGNQKLLIAHDIENEPLFSLGNKLAQQGKTPLYFTKDDKILGLIAIADTIKATSPQAIQELKNLGINIYMLTGDNQITAKQIAKQINLEENNIISDVLPQDKEAKIRQLQNQGQKVAMVGDGINDAPALARADVGIAIGAGTDIAIDSADIILMKNNLLDVVTAIKLSKAVIKNIRENLFWAFIYNIIGIPIAMGLFYTTFGLKLNPMIGALAMSFSSVFVVTNALRLRFFQNNYQTSSINKDNSSTAINIQAIDLNISKGDDNMGLLNNLFHKNSEKQTEKIISIEGMMCQHCVRHATEALEKIDGVSDVKVSLEDKNAVIHVNQNVTDEQITNAIVAAGYEIISIK